MANTDNNSSAVKQPQNTKPIGRPWKPGESGNPNGRPKRGWTWADLVEEAASELLGTTSGEKIEAKKIIAKRLVKMAAEGDRQAIKDIMDRMDGYPQQSTDLTTQGGRILNIDDLLEKVYGQTETESPKLPENS